MPVSIRRFNLTMNYWNNIKGKAETLPVKEMLKDCWEYGNGNMQILVG